MALTHMREPNDRKLAAELPEFHLILGGHDHHYVTDFIQPHNNLMVKSGEVHASVVHEHPPEPRVLPRRCRWCCKATVPTPTL